MAKPVQLSKIAVLLIGLGLSTIGAAQAQTIELEIDRNSYRAELAVTPEQRRRGLMHRPQLEPDQGMLLVYQDSGDHRIWMKNMRMALRVIWIDEHYRVIAIRRLEPCPASPCPVYAAPGPSRFVLELSDRYHDISVGDEVIGLSNW